MDKFRFPEALLVLLCMSFHVASAQIQGCSLQGIQIQLQECLDQGTNPASLESCCKTLNRAVQAGYYCFCLLMRSSAPLLGITLSLQLPNCEVFVPPLAQCQNMLPVLHPPETSFPVPKIDNLPAPANPLPEETTSEVPKQPLHQPSSESNDIMVPLSPTRNEIPQISTPANISSTAADTEFHQEFGTPQLGKMKSHGGDKFHVFLHPRIFLSVTLYAIL